KVSFPNYRGRVVQVRAAALVETDDGGGLESRGSLEHLQHLRRVEGERIPPGHGLRVWIPRQTALGKADELDPLAVSPFQPADDFAHVGLEPPAEAIELTVANAHSGTLRGDRLREDYK